MESLYEPLMCKARLIKIRIYIRQWWGVFLRETTEPFSLFSLLLIIVTINLAYQDGGVLKMWDEITKTFLSLRSFLFALAIWIPANMVVAFFKARNEVNALGEWSGQRFNFSCPRLISTAHITPKDNGRMMDITFPDLLKSLIVGYKIEYDGGLAKIQVGGVFMNAWDWINRDKQSGSFLYTRNAKILVHCPANSDQTTARIYQTYWEVPSRE